MCLSPCYLKAVPDELAHSDEGLCGEGGHGYILEGLVVDREIYRQTWPA